MRAILALLLGLAVALAGCADDDGGDTNLPPTDDGAGTTPPADQTGDGNDTNATNETGDTNETADDNETADSDEPALEPQEVVNTTFDFASGDAAGPDGKSETFDVPEGYETLHLELSASEGAGGLPSTSLNVNGRVQIADPDGQVVYDGIPAAGESEMEMVTAVPGTWTIKYTGTANVEVHTVGIVYPASSGDAAADGHGDHGGH